VGEVAVKKVFIGSTSRDLAEYRQAAIETCEKYGFAPIAMEHFPAMGVGATEGSKRKLSEADVYVGIFAHRYGDIESGYVDSVTEIEFDYAGQRGIERLCFLVDPAYPWPHDTTDLENHEKLVAFKARVERTLIRAQFTDVNDFKEKLTHALISWRDNLTATPPPAPSRGFSADLSGVLAQSGADLIDRPDKLIGRDSGHKSRLTDSSGLGQVTFTLELSLKELNVEQFVDLCAKLLLIGVNEIRVVDITKGSIHITLELSDNEAKRLERIFADKRLLEIALSNPEALEKFHLRKVALTTTAQPAIFVNTTDPVPDQPERLIGRDSVVVEVDALLDRGKCVLLYGFPGMGKTALAATIVALRVSRGVGPVLWLRAGDSPAEALLEALARPFNAHLAVASRTGDAQIAAMRQIITQAGVNLLVLDDAWNVDALRTVLKSVPRGLPVLVTSRQRYPLDEMRQIGELDADSALDLLSHYAGRDLHADPQAGELAHTLGYHAFALEIAAKTIKVDDMSPGELLSRIQAAPRGMFASYDLFDPNQKNVGNMLEVSLNALDAGLRAVFLAFGTLFAPRAVPELLEMVFAAAVEITDDVLDGARAQLPPDADLSDDDLRDRLRQAMFNSVDTAQIEKSLTILARRGLADRVPPDDEHIASYRIHDLAYSYARAQSTAEQRDHGLTACLAYTKRYNEPSLTNFAALRPLIDNFLGAARYAMETARYADVERFAWNLYSEGSEVLDYGGYYAQAVTLLALAANAAEHEGNRSGQGAHLGNLGNAYRNLGQMERAIEHYEQALAIARAIGDKRGEGNALGSLGLAYTALGQVERAIEHYEQALAIDREIGDRRGEEADLGNLGSAYHSLGQVERAIEYFEQALTIDREIGDKRGEGADLGNLGNAYGDLGQVERAIEYYGQALAIAREIGDRRGEGSRLGNLGLAYADLGQVERAIEYYGQALAIAREIGDRMGESSVLNNLGVAYEGQGDYARALTYYEQALTIFREIGASHLIAKSESHIARVREKLARPTLVRARVVRFIARVREKLAGSGGASPPSP
jgi:tetratricopeptide (TPR) repeat protein